MDTTHRKVALYIMFRVVHAKMNEEKKKINPWDEANMVQNVKNEGVHVTTVANQRYVYRRLLLLIEKMMALTV